MGVYINMEKPTSCNKCPFTCEALQFFNGTDIPQSCPLIEIDLVRCGECIYRHEHEWYNTCDKHIGHGFEDDYFCKDGERRADE